MRLKIYSSAPHRVRVLSLKHAQAKQACLSFRAFRACSTSALLGAEAFYNQTTYAILMTCPS